MRMKIFTYLLILLLVSPAVTKDFTAEQFKQDYLEACELIAKKYVYFERKSPLTRDAFIQQRVKYTNSIQWNKAAFVTAIRDLRASFPDGHFSWSIPRELSPVDGFYTLGFVPTFTSDSILVVKKIYPYYNSRFMVNDTISEINGIPATDLIKFYGKRDPQSTLNTTYEIAARNLSLIKYFSPVVDELEPLQFTVLRNGRQLEFAAEYKKCSLTTDVAESRKDSTIILLQRNFHLSLEEIPDSSLSLHPSLLLYSMMKNNKKYCVLHPRDFYGWDDSDIDTVFGMIHSLNPDVLIIDLKDSSGGGFNQMLYLSFAVNVTKDFRFFYDIIDEDNRRISGVDDFNFISEKIEVKNIWKGKLLVRSNEICGSACDFFVRWMRMNKRAPIVGTAPAGRGGGTDGFILKNTKTKIKFPLRERIPLNYPHSIEGEIFGMDYISEENLKNLLENLSAREFAW